MLHRRTSIAAFTLALLAGCTADSAVSTPAVTSSPTAPVAGTTTQSATSKPTAAPVPCGILPIEMCETADWERRVINGKEFISLLLDVPRGTPVLIPWDGTVSAARDANGRIRSLTMFSNACARLNRGEGIRIDLAGPLTNFPGGDQYDPVYPAGSQVAALDFGEGPIVGRSYSLRIFATRITNGEFDESGELPRSMFPKAFFKQPVVIPPQPPAASLYGGVIVAGDAERKCGVPPLR